LLSILQAAGWPILPLIVCSILMLALIIERFISLKVDKILPARLLDEAMNVSRNGLPSAEVVAQLARNSQLGTVLASGFQALANHPRCSNDELRSAIEAAGRLVAHRLDRYLPALSTIASAAPYLGLLGTVVGMIEIFGSQAPGGGAGNPAQMAQGISIALYNTAFGLIVAIPALIFWRYFRAKVDGYLMELELAGERFIQHLSSLRSLAPMPPVSAPSSTVVSTPTASSPPPIPVKLPEKSTDKGGKR
jgi:biopolymer transport protein ExbB